MTTELLIQNVRPMHSEATDLRLVDRRIEAMEPGLAALADGTVIDGGNRFLFPGFADAPTSFQGWRVTVPLAAGRDTIVPCRRLRRAHALGARAGVGRVRARVVRWRTGKRCMDGRDLRDEFSACPGVRRGLSGEKAFG